MDRALLACDNRAVPSFGREYFKRNRAELNGVLKLADGSTALAGFQSFGAYQRLKSFRAEMVAEAAARRDAAVHRLLIRSLGGK